MTTTPGSEASEPRRRRRGARALLVLGALAAAAVLSEVAARIVVSRIADQDTFLRYASISQLRERLATEGSMFGPHPYLGIQPRPGWVHGLNRHNSLGFRGDEFPVQKPAGEFRIVCLGGSTTYTSSVDDPRLSYPAQLERELRERGFPRVKVINAGCPDYGTHESLINFEMRVLDLDPDLVVLYHAINDVPSRLVWPPEAYRGDNSGYRNARLDPDEPAGVLEYWTALRMVAIRFGWADSRAQLNRIRPYSPAYRGLDFDLQTMHGKYPSGIFSEVPVERMLEANPPRYFRRNLEVLLQVARARKVGALLVTFACHPVDGPPRRSVVHGPVFFRAIQEHNEIVRGLAAETGTPLYDFARVFGSDVRHFHSEVRDGVTHVDAVHVSEEGAREQARLLAEHLAGSGLVPR